MSIAGKIIAVHFLITDFHGRWEESYDDADLDTGRNTYLCYKNKMLVSEINKKYVIKCKFIRETSKEEYEKY